MHAVKLLMRYQSGVPRFDHLVDDLEAFFEVGEGALHRVDGDPLKVVECPAECVACDSV